MNNKKHVDFCMIYSQFWFLVLIFLWPYAHINDTNERDILILAVFSVVLWSTRIKPYSRAAKAFILPIGIFVCFSVVNYSWINFPHMPIVILVGGLTATGFASLMLLIKSFK